MEFLHQYRTVILKLVINSVTTVLHAVWRYLLHITLTGLAVLLMLLAVVIGSNSGREFIARQAINIVNQTSGWYIQVIDLKSPSLSQWSFGSLRVFAPDEASAHVQLQHVELQLLSRPWEQPITLDQLHIRRADIDLEPLLAHLTSDAHGTERSTPTSSPQEAPASRRFGLWLNDLRIDELILRNQPGSALQGAVVGQLSWLPEQQLPTVALTWGDPRQPLASLNTDEADDWWRVQAHIDLPAGAWPHRYLSWPSDKPMQAEAQGQINLHARQVVIETLTFPWQGHAIAAQGKLQQWPDGWQFDAVSVQVDDFQNRLSGTWRDDYRALNADLHLPFSLAQPWLPDWLNDAAAVQPGDDLVLRVDWPANAPWTLNGEARAHWYGDRAVLRLRGQGTELEADTLDASLRVGASELSLQGNWSWPTQMGAVNLVSTLDPALVAPWWSHPGLSSAVLQGQLTGGGRDSNGAINWPQWEGVIAANGRWPSGPNLADLPWQARAEAALNFPHLQWSALTLDIQAAGQNAQLNSEGAVDFARQHLDVDWRLEEIPVDQIAALWQSWPDGLRMRLTGAGQVTGDWNDPQGRANLSARGLWQGSPWSANLDAPELSTQRVNIAQLNGRWRGSQIAAEMDVLPNTTQSWQQWPMTARIDPLRVSFPDLAAHIPQWPDELPSGLVALSLNVSGLLGNPDILAAAEVSASYAGHPLDGALTWSDDQLVADFTWQDRSASVQGSGRPWATGDWHLILQRLQTDDFTPWVDIPDDILTAQFRHDLHLRIAGGPEQADISLTSQHAGRWDNRAVRADMDASAQWQRDHIAFWDIHQLDVNWGDANLSASGRSTNEGWLPESFSAQMQDFPLHHFLPVADLDSRVSGSATVSADWPEWSGDVDLRVAGQQRDDPLQGRVVGNFFGSGTRIGHAQLETLNVTLGEALTVTGQGGYSPELWNLRLNWQGVNVRPPANSGLPQAEWLGSGALAIAGAGDDPEISLSSNWQTRLSTADNGEQLDLNLDLDIVTSDQDIEGLLTFRRPGRQLAQLGATLPRRPLNERLAGDWEGWEFGAFWDVDINMSDLFFWLGFEYVQIDGQLRGDGVVGGILGNPQTDGNLAWMNGALRIPEAGAELDRINVTLVANDLTSLAVNGSARSGNGSANINGTLELRNGLPDADIDIRLNRAAVVQRSDVQGLGTGTLNLSGTWPNLLIAGDLGLHNLSIQINRLAGPAVAQLEIADELNGNGASVASTIRLNIGLRTLDVATITGNGLNARLSGELRLLGTASELETDGAFIFESGTFNLLTREFRLEEGEVRLVDEALNINLLAVYDRTDTRIEARVTGNADQLQLQLTSQPMLPEDEIVAQLLFGKTIQNMTPFQALQLASAVNQLRGGDTFDLIIATRDSLGLDTLEIDNIGEEESDIVVRVGKYLNSRVYVELDTELSDERDWRGSVEVELTPNLSVETFTRSGSTFGGVELRWRRDY